MKTRLCDLPIHSVAMVTSGDCCHGNSGMLGWESHNTRHSLSRWHLPCYLQRGEFSKKKGAPLMLSWQQDDTGDFMVAMTTRGIAMECHMTKHCGPVERLDGFHGSYALEKLPSRRRHWTLEYSGKNKGIILGRISQWIILD